MTQVDFLDITINMEKNKFWPYRKPNDTPLYIHTSSNHPPNIIKELPNMINKRLSDISSTPEDFNTAKKDYEKALKNSGHNTPLTYNPSKDKQTKRTRKRNIIWYNPPYNAEVTTNIGKAFFNALNKHFPKNNKYHKLFNKNTTKLSYSCTSNVKTIISAHNKKLLKTHKHTTDTITETTTTTAATITAAATTAPAATNSNDTTPTTATATAKTCNCRQPAECPMSGKCLSAGIVYKSTITTTNNNTQTQKTYIGATETTFKTRYGNHKKSFTHQKYRNESKLSQEVWDNKEKGLDPKTTWEILKRGHAYTLGNKKCDLCISEALLILQEKATKEDACLNHRNELKITCRHASRFRLINTAKITY